MAFLDVAYQGFDQRFDPRKRRSLRVLAGMALSLHSPR